MNARTAVGGAVAVVACRLRGGAARQPQQAARPLYTGSPPSTCYRRHRHHLKLLADVHWRRVVTMVTWFGAAKPAQNLAM